jgi:hypothetical protein
MAVVVKDYRQIVREVLHRSLAIEAEDDRRLYQGDPIAFIETVLGDTLTIEQKAILTRIKDGGEINVQAAHGVGKSFIASRIVFYQTVVLRSETITTAPTFRQVANVLWKEVRKLNTRVKKDFTGVECGRVFLRYSGGGATPTGDGSAFGFTAQHNSTDAFQGVHAAGLTVIIDEACGVSNEIDEGATACAVDAAGAIVRIGNPTNPNTAFAKACKSPGTIKIPVWNHPNVSWAYDRSNKLHEWVSVAIGLESGKCAKRSIWAGKLQNLKDPIPGAVSIEWIEKVRHKFGEDSAYWQSRVCAEFPDNASDGIIPHSWLVQARNRYDKDPEYWDGIAARYYWQLGLDIADGGGDRHALAAWGGRSVLYSISEFIPKGDRQDTMRIVGIVGKRIKSYRDCSIAVDNLGAGAGSLSRLKELGFMAEACTFSAKPTESPDDGTSYRNLKAQLFWELREDLQAGTIAIAPLGDLEDSLFEELVAIRYDVNSAGVICCEEKAIVRKQLGRSPDLADAVVIARSLSELYRSGIMPIGQEHMGIETLSELDNLSEKLGL